MLPEPTLYLGGSADDHQQLNGSCHKNRQPDQKRDSDQHSGTHRDLIIFALSAQQGYRRSRLQRVLTVLVNPKTLRQKTSTMVTVKRIVLSRITPVLTSAVLLGAALLAGACSDGADDEATPAQPDSTPTTASTTTATSAAAGGSSPSTTASDSVAVSWPHDWTEDRVGGGLFDAGDYEGQDLVLWFWAPW